MRAQRDFGLPDGVRLGIFAALLPTGEYYRPRPLTGLLPEAVRPQAGCELRPVPHRKRPRTWNCNRTGRHRCRCCSRCSGFSCTSGRRLFLGSRDLLDCFFLFSRLFSRLFFGRLAANSLACGWFFPRGLPGRRLLLFSGFLSGFFSCFLLRFRHVTLLKKVAQDAAPESTATQSQQPDVTYPSLPTSAEPASRPTCAGSGCGFCSSSQCNAATALLTRSRYKTSGSRLTPPSQVTAFDIGSIATW